MSQNFDAFTQTVTQLQTALNSSVCGEKLLKSVEIEIW